MEPNPIERACEIAGGQASLARHLGIKPPNVNDWVSGARPIPDSRCVAIERLTEGAVTCEQLRHDIDWVRVADGEWPWHPAGRPLIDVTRAALAAGEGAHA